MMGLRTRCERKPKPSEEFVMEIQPEKRNHNFRDLTGMVFNRFTVVEFEGVKKGQGRWLCRCECGAVASVTSARLKNGHTKSCGCWSHKFVAQSRTTHGQTGTRLYRIWVQIINRCTNARTPAYPDYGGRGITICDRWRSSFEAFAEDMGQPTSSAHTIDRIDNDSGYSMENCRWATKHEQARNTRGNTLITFNGETHCISEWADIVGIHQDVIGERIRRRGWSVERALTTPPRKWPSQLS